MHATPVSSADDTCNLHCSCSNGWHITPEKRTF